jgi:DNA adenine methylase
VIYTLLEPAIKWSGSKRSIAKDIVECFPLTIDTYYEPFCGGCSVLYYMLNNGVHANRYICSDINSDLINLWNTIKNNHLEVIYKYDKMWNEMQALDIEDRKEYFYNVRTRFNREKSPFDFMFIMRTTTNGMPRYNKNGEFNNSFHITRSGINPKKFQIIINKWNRLLNKYNVEFLCQSYNNITSNKNDVVYLDPPYANTKGMYYGKIDYNELWDWIRNQKCFIALSFDGKTTSTEYRYEIPDNLFKNHKLLYTGNSPFRRTIGKSSSEYVYESLYII